MNPQSIPPEELLRGLIALMIPLTYAAMVLVERCGSGLRWPVIAHWQWIGAAGFRLLGVVNALVSTALLKLFGNVHLIDTSEWGVLQAALFGYLWLSLGNALLHRAYHHFDWLWRHVHQLHHAPQRIDVAGVMFQTPLEAAANAVLFMLVSVFLLGLSPLATMLLAYIGSFYGMFQHFNVRTPRLLGYLIQRPEAHCEHHRRGHHRYNYSDLPIWDWFAGSLRNPARFSGEVGFAAPLGEIIVPMLRGQSLPEAAVRGAAPARDDRLPLS